MTRTPLDLRPENGSIVVFTGMLMLFFVLLGVVAVDVGNWFVHKRHLQTQVDAAALAGGGMMADCFADKAAGSTSIENEATKYSGAAGSLYNAQVGNANRGTITMRYNKKTYLTGGPAADDTEELGACFTSKLMFDVKGSEEDLPTIINFPGISTLASVRAHARVELKKVKIFKGSLPLAVPEVRPKHVTATFVNEAGATVAGPLDLTGPTASGSLNAWTGSGSVVIPSSAKVGVRIGVGQVAGTCNATTKTGGTGFVCYDYSTFDKGLVSIAGFDTAGTPTAPTRSSFEVWPVTACSGSPFFSDTALTGGATSCAAAVQAKLHFASGTVVPADVQKFEATVKGPKGFNVTVPLTESGGIWSTGYAFNIPFDAAAPGIYDVSIEWKYKSGSNAKYTDVQTIYAGSDDSGPIKVLTLSAAGGTTPYALAAGTQTVTVNVAIEGSLQLTPTGTLIMLRLTGGSRTSAVACDGPGAAEFRNSIINGCVTPYQLNSAGICPDPAPPSGPADCVPTKTGTTAGPTLQGLDDRFAACPSYNSAPYPLADPRIVPLMITDFSALGGSGTTTVPVTNFATFYVAGWTGSKCGNNPPPPPGYDINKGAIWGHFIGYAKPDPNAEAGETCDLTSITPCVPVLTR